MIEDEADLKHSDPPRLNRCEKQRLTYLDVLGETGGPVGERLFDSLRDFCDGVSSFAGSRLGPRDAIFGYTQNSLPSLLVREVAAAAKELGCAGDGSALDAGAIHRRCMRTLLDLMPADAVARTECSRFAQSPDNEAEVQGLIAAWYARSEHAGLCECLA